MGLQLWDFATYVFVFAFQGWQLVGQIAVQGVLVGGLLGVVVRNISVLDLDHVSIISISNAISGLLNLHRTRGLPISALQQNG